MALCLYQKWFFCSFSIRLGCSTQWSSTMSFTFRLAPSLKLTKALYQTLSKRNYTANTTVYLKTLNSKISNYMRNGLVEEAQNLFDKMPQRNTVTWNAMICGYFQNGRVDRAMHLYNRMPDRDIYSYNTVVSGLMRCCEVRSARDVFYGMPFRDIVSWNAMLSGYVHNGLVDEGFLLFDMMPLKDVVSYNLMISGLLKCGELDLAEELFREMGTHDVVSWTLVMSGLLSAGRVVEAREIFESMPVNIGDVQAWNTMITGYIDNGYLEDAQILFHKMPVRDLNSWNGMITGLVNVQRLGDAMRLFWEMPQKYQRTWNLILTGLSRNGLVKEAHAVVVKTPYADVVSLTNMMIGYFHIGDVQTAVELFELVPFGDTTLWNAAIFGLGENDCGEDGFKLFERMIELGVPVDEFTFTSALTICSTFPSLNLGKQTHAQSIKMGFDSVNAVCNAMVTMYARCGNMDSALIVFSSMSSHNVISWNSIIGGFAHHGDGEKALHMFNQMRLTIIKPNQITFIGVLSACSHTGLVEQGKYCFHTMKYKYFLQPMSGHYTCIVDLIGRFGHIDEAMKFLDQMRYDEIEVSGSVWGALLGACRIHNNINVGEIAGEKVLELEPWNSGVYMILAEMYANSGRKKEAENMWRRMKEMGVKKQPGCSWIEVNNSGHVFLSGDGSHPGFHNMCSILELLLTEMEIEILNPNASSCQDTLAICG